MSMNKTEKIVYDSYVLIKTLEERPETYKTILKYDDSNTLMTILRRKMSKMVKNNFICKTTLPGHRLGRSIFYSLNKKYKILVLSERTGIKVFYFNKFKYIDKFNISVDNYYRLKNDRWEKVNKPRKFFYGNVLKFI